MQLGLPGDWASESEEKSHYNTKCGGHPDWPEGCGVVPQDRLSCQLCGKPITLVVQAYCPLTEQERDLSERTLYLFGCHERSCSRSNKGWKLFRLQKTQKVGRDKEDLEKLPDFKDIGFDVPDWNEGFSESSTWDESFVSDFKMEELSAALQKATLNAANDSVAPVYSKGKQMNSSASKENSSAALSDFPVLPCFYIYAEEETTKKSLQKQHTAESHLAEIPSTSELPSNDGGNEMDESWEGEEYEYDQALTVDRTFLKFRKRIQENPNQCLRYKFEGDPLWASVPKELPEPCEHCGEERVFEVQAMPPLLYFFQEASERASFCGDAWEWVTVVAFSCRKSCSKLENEWEMFEEKIVVQNEI